MRELHRAGDAERREAREVVRVRGTARARCAAAGRAAPRRRASPRTRRAPRGSPRSPIACTATGQPAAAPRADDLLRARRREVIARREPSSIQRGLRAERPVHERLEVAEPEEVVAEPRREGRARAARRPARAGATATRGASAPRARGCGRRSRRAEPAVLVVDRGDAAAFARRIPSRVAATHSSSVTVTKRSRKRQADSSRRMPGRRRRASSRSTTPPGTSRSPPARASAAVLSQSEW